jgi:hypothetical protein
LAAVKIKKMIESLISVNPCTELIIDNLDNILTGLKITGLAGIGIWTCFSLYNKYSNLNNNNNDNTDTDTVTEISRLDSNSINDTINNDSVINLQAVSSAEEPSLPLNEEEIAAELSKTDELLGILYKTPVNTVDELENYNDTINKGGLDKDSWIDFAQGINESDSYVELVAKAVEPFSSITCESILKIIDPHKFLESWDHKIDFNKPSEIIRSLVDTALDSDMGMNMPECFHSFDLLELFDNTTIRTTFGLDGAEAVINMEGAAEYFCLHYASYRCFNENIVASSADYIDIRALFSAALALTLYKLIKSNLPKKFYKKGVSGANDFSFLSGFCIHDYFLLFKESFLSIIFDEDLYYSFKNNALLTIKRVIFNESNIQLICPRSVPSEERLLYKEKHLYFASMVYWLDHSHSISNALNLSRPSHFTRNFEIEMECWRKSARLPGSIPFYRNFVMAGSIATRGGPGENNINFRRLQHYWNLISRNEDIGHFKQTLFHRFDARLFSSIQEKQGFSSPMLRCLYNFIKVQKKNYRTSCITSHSKFLFNCSYNFSMPSSWEKVFFGDDKGKNLPFSFCREYETLIDLFCFFKRILPRFGWFFDLIPGALDAALRHYHLRLARERHY